MTLDAGDGIHSSWDAADGKPGLIAPDIRDADAMQVERLPSPT